MFLFEYNSDSGTVYKCQNYLRREGANHMREQNKMFQESVGKLILNA